jgi:hypothetical protein
MTCTSQSLTYTACTYVPYICMIRPSLVWRAMHASWLDRSDPPARVIYICCICCIACKRPIACECTTLQRIYIRSRNHRLQAANPMTWRPCIWDNQNYVQHSEIYINCMHDGFAESEIALRACDLNQGNTSNIIGCIDNLTCTQITFVEIIIIR